MPHIYSDARNWSIRPRSAQGIASNSSRNIPTLGGQEAGNPGFGFSTQDTSGWDGNRYFQQKQTLRQ